MPPRALDVLVAGEEDQPVLADLDLVAVGQRDRLDPVAVDVGAVEASDVAHRVAVAGAVEDRVPTGDGDVVEEDLAVGVAAGIDDVLVEEEATACSRTLLDDEQGGSDGQRVDRGRVDGAELAIGGLDLVA